MMEKIRVLLIDPEKEQITEHFIEPILSSYYALIGCELIEAVHPDVLSRHFLYVDEEALLKNDQYFFGIGGYPQPLAGKAVVLATDREGNDLQCDISIDLLNPFILFMGKLQK